MGEVNREEIIRMAREAGAQGIVNRDFIDIEKFAALVAAAEREACAKVAENGMLGITIAKAIRARGKE